MLRLRILQFFGTLALFLPSVQASEHLPFTYDPNYSGRSALLKQWWYKEPSPLLPFSGTYDEFVQNRRYLSGHEWWLVAGTVANIDVSNSRSFLARYLGRDSFREIYWANDGFGGADLQDLRIAVGMSKRDGQMPQERLLEMFVRNPETGEPEPFAFLRQGDRWIPIDTVDGLDLKTHCKICHHDEEGRLVPFPISVFPSVDSLKHSGYYSEYWQQLLDPESLWVRAQQPSRSR